MGKTFATSSLLAYNFFDPKRPRFQQHICHFICQKFWQLRWIFQNFLEKFRQDILGTFRTFHQKLWIPSKPGVFQFCVFRIACLTSSRVISTGGTFGSSAQFLTSAIQLASSESCLDSNQMPLQNVNIVEANG
jgi:hypothetical protein